MSINCMGFHETLSGFLLDNQRVSRFKNVDIEVHSRAKHQYAIAQHFSVAAEMHNVKIKMESKNQHAEAFIIQMAQELQIHGLQAEFIGDIQ